MVFLELVTAWRLAASPTNRSPDFVKATTDGVTRRPSEFSSTTGSPPSMTAMHEFVVPRSMPITFAILDAPEFNTSDSYGAEAMPRADCSAQQTCMQLLTVINAVYVTEPASVPNVPLWHSERGLAHPGWHSRTRQNLRSAAGYSWGHPCIGNVIYLTVKPSKRDQAPANGNRRSLLKSCLNLTSRTCSPNASAAANTASRRRFTSLRRSSAPSVRL